MELLGEPKVIYGRRAFMPEFTPVFSELDLNCPVRDGDALLGFTIRDVLPERRWAIQPNGQLLAENDFRQRFLSYASRVVDKGQVISIASKNGLFDANLIPVPTPRAFVSVAHDFQGREIAIGFDPNRPARGGEKFELRDGRGNVVDPLGPSQVQRMAVIADLREKGLLSDEQVADELSDTLRVPTRVKVEPAEEAPDNGAKNPSTYQRDPVLSLCGRSCKGMAGKLAHERKCVKCRAITAEQSANPPEEAA